MSYNILTDELPNHFAYYAVDRKKTACRILMIPAKSKGADLSSLSELYAIAVYIDHNDVIFKRMPQLANLSTDDVNTLVTTTKQKPLQVQKILNVTTGITQKTKSTVSNSINYGKASISKIIKDSKDTNIASYIDEPVYRNNQRFDKNGKAIKTELSIDDFINNGAATEKFIDTFYTPVEHVNGIAVLKIYDKYGNRVQVSYVNKVISANDVIMTSSTTPYYIAITITDGTNTRSDSISVYQRDADGETPTTFFDTFGNTVVGIENNMLKVKRTRLPLVYNTDNQPIMVDVSKSTIGNKRLIDVIS